MTEFNSETCVNKLLQGCQYTAGKCPCRLKKTRSEQEYDQRENYVRRHWKSVVLCSECVFCEKYDGYQICRMWSNATAKEGWCYMGEKK